MFILEKFKVHTIFLRRKKVPIIFSARDNHW